MTDITYKHLQPFVTQTTNVAENNAEFKFTQYYINESSYEITVTLRNNLPIVIAKSLGKNKDNKKFIIRNVYSFRNSEQIISTINNITEHQKIYSDKQEELSIIKKILLTNYNNDRFISSVNVYIDYQLEINDIRELDILYLPEADILVNFGCYNTSYPHPFSSEGTALFEYTEVIKNKKISGIFAEIIDNENNIKNRYMYVAKQLLELPVKKDKNKASGVYFSKANNDRLDEVHIKPEFYSFDKAEEELGLYKTKEEALTGGNPEHISKQDLINKEQELIELKHRLNKTDIENKETINTLELKLEKLKKENSSIKEKHEKRKIVRNDYYEEKSQIRKDNSEFIKYAPAAIAGLLAVLAIYNSSKN